MYPNLSSLLQDDHACQLLWCVIICFVWVRECVCVCVCVCVRVWCVCVCVIGILFSSVINYSINKNKKH